MAERNIPIWTGNPRTFAQLIASSSDPTPFGLYDGDNEFTASAPKVAKYCAHRLGFPIVDIELQDLNFYTCFEDAVNMYGAEVNSYNIRNNLLDLQGVSTSDTTNVTQKVITTNLGRIITIAKQYGAEAGSGGDVTWHKGYITTIADQQEYDLDTLFYDSSGNQNVGSGSLIELKRVYHEEPPAKVRYYDPYAGTGLGTYNILQQFGWDQMSPAVSFVMMPLYEDLLRLQAIEFNQMIRRSTYTWKLINNRLHIFPIPDREIKVYFDYIFISDRNNPIKSGDAFYSDYSDVPYQAMTYTRINQVGKQWIRDYSYILSKEMLGLVRSKYQSIPIPDGDVSLDGETLRSEAASEKEQMLTQLRETLEATSRRQLMENRAEEAEQMQNVLGKGPLNIYIGSYLPPLLLLLSNWIW